MPHEQNIIYTILKICIQILFLFSAYCIILCYIIISNSLYGGGFLVSQGKKSLGLVPKLLIGIIAGILIGMFFPKILVQILVTIASIFSLFLKFVIPFIILSFVIAGIADLSQGAGKLLGITTAIAYGSTITAGMLAYLVSTTIFPTILGSDYCRDSLA